MFLKIAILTKPIWAVLSVWNIRWVQRQDYRMFGVDCLCKWAFPFVSCDPIDNITLSDIPAYHLSQGNSRFFSFYEWWAPYFTSYDHVRWDPIKLPYAWKACSTVGRCWMSSPEDCSFESCFLYKTSILYMHIFVRSLYNGAIIHDATPLEESLHHNWYYTKYHHNQCHNCP